MKGSNAGEFEYLHLHEDNKQQMRFQAPSTSSRRRKVGRSAYLQENIVNTEEDGEDKEKIIDIWGRTQKKNRLT